MASILPMEILFSPAAEQRRVVNLRKAATLAENEINMAKGRHKNVPLTEVRGT